MDIEKMTSRQWLNYRDDLLNNWVKKGNVLTPNIYCADCNPADEYTCFICEINQVESAAQDD